MVTCWNTSRCSKVNRALTKVSWRGDRGDADGRHRHHSKPSEGFVEQRIVCCDTPRSSGARNISAVCGYFEVEENVMSRRNVLGVIVGILTVAAGSAGIHASRGHGRTLVVTMTNDPNENQLRVYDAQSHVLLQTLSTHGKGGVGGNARGIKKDDGRLVALVNNGSNSVALFRRDGDVLKFDKVVSTTSPPVSVD